MGGVSGTEIRILDPRSFDAPEGVRQNYGIEPSTFWDSRALSKGSSLGDPSGSSWDSSSNVGDHLPSHLGDSWGPGWGLIVHPTGPSSWAFFLAP
jgi:hypothetical protein